MMVLMAAFLALSTSAQQSINFIEMGTLPEVISGNSGLAVASDDSFWAIDRKGGKAEVYEIDIRGDLLRTVRIEGAENVDFEDMTQDSNGNIFVGDFGNTDKNRQKMIIYRFSTAKIKVDQERSTDKLKSFKVIAEKIEYVLPFEAMRSECHYDVQSMIWNDDALMLFTRDRCDKTDNMLHFYSLPDAPGIYTARDEGYFNWEDPEANIIITGADLSVDGRSLALLSDDAVHLFFGYKKDRYFGGSYRYIPMEKTERLAICHIDDCNLYVTEVSSENGPGRIQKINLCSVEMD